MDFTFFKQENANTKTAGITNHIGKNLTQRKIANKIHKKKSKALNYFGKTFTLEKKFEDFNLYLECLTN